MRIILQIFFFFGGGGWKKKKNSVGFSLIPGFLREISKFIKTDNFSCGTCGRVLLSAPINLLWNEFFTTSDRDEVEKLVSFWSKNRVHVSRVYGEGLGNCVCGIVFNFLAVFSCELFSLLDLLFCIFSYVPHRFRLPLVVHHLVLRNI